MQNPLFAEHKVPQLEPEFLALQIRLRHLDDIEYLKRRKRTANGLYGFPSYVLRTTRRPPVA